jgi:hypothetical protein
MPTLTLTFTYDGSDPEIMQALSGVGAALGGSTAHSVHNNSRQSSKPVERIASEFAGYVSQRDNLKNVMLAWLRHDGKISLSELVKISGVKKQHDYAGIGSALTRNMKKADGPGDWYDCIRNVQGEWIYEIADELVQPLKRAFSL